SECRSTPCWNSARPAARGCPRVSPSWTSRRLRRAMARLLLIDPDRGTVAALQKALAVAGLTDVSAVISGSFALTMLERDRPDLIVSRARIPDLDRYHPRRIRRTHPALTG